jgi:acyl carrier protein
VSESVEQRTRRLVAEVFGLPLDSVSRATSHETVEEWDSINVLNLLMAVESEFEVVVSPEEAASFMSVEKILAVLRTKGIQ